MKVRNWGIGKKLNIALTVIFFFTGLGLGIALLSAQALWGNTAELYDHPFTVRSAIGELQKDILSVQHEMHHLVEEKDVTEIDVQVAGIEAHEADAYRQIDILFERYLGDNSDLKTFVNEYGAWSTIGAETIHLTRQGEYEKAQERLSADGIYCLQADALLGYLDKISDFAQGKADEFYHGAQQHNTNIQIQLGVTLGCTFLILLFVGMVMKRSIMRPLTSLTSTTDELRRGNLSARCNYLAKNEFGGLATAINEMSSSLETELRFKENVNRVSGLMLHHEGLRFYCRQLLNELGRITGSQSAAIYVLNQDSQRFEHYESIGLNEERIMSFSAETMEGEFGSVLVSGEIQHIKDIPDNTSMTFLAVSGEYRPREIISIPVKNGTVISAVISLSTVSGYTPEALRLVGALNNEISTSYASLFHRELSREYSETLQDINVELEAQAKELVMQSDELKEQNIELEMQKDRLDEASRLKSTFLANMSHELRTPLNSVIALASVLSRRLHGKIAQEEYSYLDIIERNGRNLLTLVNEILDLSRIEAGREDAQPVRFNFNDLMIQIIETLGPQAREKGIRLIYDHDSTVPPMFTDMQKCRHIIQNVVGNAVKFTDQGYVRISADVVGNLACIRVEDTGIGIVPEQIGYIFEEFRQADETPSRHKDGAGLGLAIAKKYADMLGGMIEVKSTHGEGSVFTISIPIVLTNLMPNTGMGFETPVRKAATDFDNAQSRRILIIEDSQPAIIQIRDILETQGYQVDVAQSGKEALERLIDHQPDGIILDLMMPEMDGFEVVRRIRSENAALIPILILTAKHITREELAFLKGNHISQLIQKGAIDKNELLTAVGNLVADNESANKLRHPPVFGKPMILLIDDNSDNRTTVNALLGKHYDITEAQDGVDGIEKAKRIRLDLILLDISLPGVDGFRVLDMLKDDDALASIPVVALTARAMAGDREEILAYGFDGYVSKPISEKQIYDQIRRLLDERK